MTTTGKCRQQERSSPSQMSLASGLLAAPSQRNFLERSQTCIRLLVEITAGSHRCLGAARGRWFLPGAAETADVLHTSTSACTASGSDAMDVSIATQVRVLRATQDPFGHTILCLAACGDGR